MNIDIQFKEIRTLILNARKRALKTVNRELIDLYWKIGKYIHKKVETSEWGKSIVTNLADYLKETKPNASGFSAQNLWRMKQFYGTNSSN